MIASLFMSSTNQGLLLQPNSRGGIAIVSLPTASDPGELAPNGLLLTAYDTAASALQSGMLVYIRDTKRLYELSREDTDAPNGDTIIEANPAEGGGNFRLIAGGGAGSAMLFGSSGVGQNSMGESAAKTFGPTTVGTFPAQGAGSAFVMPRAGVLRDLHARLVSARGSVNTFDEGDEITVRAYVDNIASGLEAVIDGGDADADVSDTAHAVYVAAGAEVNLVVETPATEASQPSLDGISISITFG